MTTYYAKNTPMNLTDANAWNTAANGSGTDWTYEAGVNILDANGKAITLDADVSATKLQTSSGVGGHFEIPASTSRTITADLQAAFAGASTPTLTQALITVASGQTLTLTGNLTAQTNTYACAIWCNGGTVNITGNSVSTATYSYPLFVSGGTANWTGNPTATGSGRGCAVYGGTLNLSGNPQVTGTSYSGQSGVFVAGGTLNLTGYPVTIGGNGHGIYLYGGTCNWKNQTVNFPANTCGTIYNDAGTLDLSGLIVNNFGVLILSRSGTSPVTTNATTRVYNRTATAQAAGNNFTLPVTRFGMRRPHALILGA
jgi:hypothetical protein